MNSFVLKFGRPLATVSLAALLAAAPLSLEIAKDGAVSLKPSTALAESGSGKDGSGGGSDSSGSGSDGSGGSDSSGSGSDGSGGSDDSSGSGSSGSGGSDDSSGSGSSGSGGSDDSSGSGSSGSGSSDDSSGSGSSGSGSSDDSSGSGSSGSSSDDSSGSSKSGSGSTGSSSVSSSGSDDGFSKIEINGDHIEITFADGTKVEIENGIFERKDATGRTVEQRPATPQDFANLEAAAASLGGSASIETVNSDGARVEIRGDGIEITHADGWKEEIENGQYELKDPEGNTVIERAATPADEARLRDAAGA